MSWQVLALHYASNPDRTRRDSFLFDTDPDAPHPMDFFFWVLRRGEEIIVVDTGMDQATASRRGRTVTTEPAAMLAALQIDPAEVKTVVVTHLHFDHAACLSLFPNATVHIQAAELAVATGPMMGHPVLGMPYLADHVAEMVRIVHAGRAVVHEGRAVIADGVTGHLVGGHARGLMGLVIETERGPVVLASDVAHFYESIVRRPIFQIVMDPEAMVRGYDWLMRTGGSLEMIVPAHDPLVRRVYPRLQGTDAYELSAPPMLSPETLAGRTP